MGRIVDPASKCSACKKDCFSGKIDRTRARYITRIVLLNSISIYWYCYQHQLDELLNSTSSERHCQSHLARHARFAAPTHRWCGVLVGVVGIPRKFVQLRWTSCWRNIQIFASRWLQLGFNPDSDLFWCEKLVLRTWLRRTAMWMATTGLPEMMPIGMTIQWCSSWESSWRSWGWKVPQRRRHVGGGLLEKVESAAWSQILAWLLHVTTIRVTYSSLFSIFNFWSCGYSFRSHRPVSCQHPLVKNNAETASSSEAFKRTEEHFRERQWCWWFKQLRNSWPSVIQKPDDPIIEDPPNLPIIST